MNQTVSVFVRVIAGLEAEPRLRTDEPPAAENAASSEAVWANGWAAARLLEGAAWWWHRDSFFRDKVGGAGAQSKPTADTYHGDHRSSDCEEDEVVARQRNFTVVTIPHGHFTALLPSLMIASEFTQPGLNPGKKVRFRAMWAAEFRSLTAKAGETLGVQVKAGLDLIAGCWAYELQLRHDGIKSLGLGRFQAGDSVTQHHSRLTEGLI